MVGTCKEWFETIGRKSTVETEPYTHLVWCAALASKVENFTSYNTARDAITLVRQLAFEHGHHPGGALDQYLENIERVTAPVA